jgi:Tfp pilus assembly protein FimT
MRQGERTVHGRQGGISLTGLIVVLIVLAVVALFGMKVVPSYMEFRSARGAIQSLARETQGASPADIRRRFEARATIDDIESVKPADLEISKQGNEVTIAFAYRKEVPLFTGVALCIDYHARAGGQ